MVIDQSSENRFRAKALFENSRLLVAMVRDQHRSNLSSGSNDLNAFDVDNNVKKPPSRRF